MNFGLKGRHALVCASSRGLGRACAESLAGEGVNLTIVARGLPQLQETAQNIRERFKVTVHAVAADITTQAGRASAIAAHPDVDILVNNAGGPPPGDFRNWERDTWLAALDANMLAPIEMIRALIDGMVQRRFGRIINITSATVKAPIDILGLSNGARSGLTGFIAGLARTHVANNVTINNLLPGPFETERLLETARQWAQDRGSRVEDVLEARRCALPAKRFGSPSELGDACAFLCSAQAGFITGHNLLMDGGAFPGTL